MQIGEFVDGQTIGQLTGEFVDGQTTGQLTRRTDNWSTHVDGQAIIGQLTGEFVDGQTIINNWSNSLARMVEWW
jgi:hypothetical protein